jgi:thioredoxin reductase (NADPH)
VTHDILIVGAGPAGLAAAIAARQAGLDVVVVERGVLVNSIFHFPRGMVFFTTPELLEIGGLPFVTPYEKPTRAEALRYYRRVADAYALPISFGEEVAAIDRPVDAGRHLRVRTRAEGAARTREARAVIVATGTYDRPNRLGVPGEDLPHVSHYYTEPHAWYRRPVVVVGGKNSAAEAALDLYRAGASVTLVHRGPALGASIKYWVKPDIENRIKAGSIAARFLTTVREIRPDAVLVNGPDGGAELPAAGVFLLTGHRGDMSIVAAAGVAIDPDTCGPVFAPETFETNVPGIYVIGSIVAGVQSGKVFIENGRFHGQAAVAAIARRLGRPTPPPGPGRVFGMTVPDEV